MERERVDVDVVCVGFGPATGGFLTTISREIPLNDGTFPQVICYERADDLAFGVSGVVTKGRGLRVSFPDLNPAEIPMAAPVASEKVYYLLDPVGASRRSATLRAADAALRVSGSCKDEAFELPYIPPFLEKHGGLVMSIGQFNQWVGQQVMMTGAAQVWPGTPVAEALIDGDTVRGVQLADQGVDLDGNPTSAFQPGMEIHAPLTVIGDGPVGPVGRQLDEHFGLPPGHEQREWAVGMKMVVDLPEGCTLAPGTVFHTFGYPEPEIFGFLYVQPDSVASVGIFIPSWLENPVRTSYRYLQHYLLHPLVWKHLQGGRMRSWGAKTLNESGRRGEPYLVGDGWARIGEGSGSTNVLAGSGVDEAWTTGVQLGKAVLELWREGAPFTKENLERTYVTLRRNSWVEEEARVAEYARDGFHRGVVPGMLGMALAGFSGGRLHLPGLPEHAMPTLEDFFSGRIPPEELAALKKQAETHGEALHDLVMNRCGWPEIPYDGQLLMSQQDALLLGGKVQAAPGYANHVRFRDDEVCGRCGAMTCVEICSAQALMPGKPTPSFDREKCIHCGACIWNCEFHNVDFRAGAGGLHSAEN
ncbi:MAG: 4Fe-4S binding protein [Bryobacterales bacterium]|nr:4Fe-4S binding protein [Bryobacterales bacterium]